MLCPRCNNNLPDNSIACNYCGFQFTAVLAHPAYGNQNYTNQYQKNKATSTILDIIVRLIVIIGIIISSLSVFPKFYEIYDEVQSLSENIFSSFIEFAIYIWLIGITIGLFCLPSNHKLLQSILRSVMSLFGLLLCIVFTAHLHTVAVEDNAPLAVGYFAFELRAGFYFMFIGFLICLVSSILSIFLARKNK